MEFLELEEIEISKHAIVVEYESLLEKIPGIRRKSKQWQFLDLCFKRTVLGEKAMSENLEANANYYKFEVQNILERYYSQGFQSISYVFTLMHKKDIDRFGFDLEENHYPSTYGYFLLIRKFKAEDSPGSDITVVKEYLLKVVCEGIKEEFNAYRNLPAIDSQPLLTWFDENGSAYNEIMSTLLSVQKKGWVLNNRYNPSHQLVKSVKLAEFKKDSALVRTIEYNYLKWYCLEDNGYTYVYRETSNQSYQLTRKKGVWLIEATIRRMPLTSLPRRQAEYRKN